MVMVVTLVSLLTNSKPVAGQSNVVSWANDVPIEATNAVAVAMGWEHRLVLRRDGTPVAWGYNQFGQNNVPGGLTNVVAISAPPGGFYSLALRADGRVAVWPANFWPAIQLPEDLTNAAAVAAGVDHALALRTDGTVAVWGNNYSGQLDIPPGISNVVAVAAGQVHSLALKADGRVVAWGSSSDGQIYVPFDLTNAVAIAAGGWQSVALRADGAVVSWGQTATVPASISNVIEIAAGNDPVIALKANGTLTAWGIGSAFVPPGLSNVATMVYGLAAIGVGPPFLTTPLVNRTVLRNGTVYFRVAASGERPLNYQWQFNGANLAGANNALLALTNAQLTQSGTYTVIVSNAVGVASNSATLTVIPQIAHIIATSLIVTNGHVQFHATGDPPGTRWTLQASTNLTDWVSLGTLQSDTGTMTFTDPSTVISRRFYRLRLRP